MATTMHGSLQVSSSEMTRRNVIRWVGRVAVAGALTTLGVSGLSDTAEAGRRSKHRRKQRRQTEPQKVSSEAIEATALPEDQIDSDLDVTGWGCRWRTVCYSNGVCVRRKICR